MTSKHPHISCESCDKTFKEATQLKNHHKNYHQSSIVINYTNYEGELKTLTLDRDKNDNFICPICSLESKTSSGLRSHFVRQKGNCAPCLPTLQIYIDGVVCRMKPSFDREYRCIICNVNIKEPKEHFKSQHFNYDIHIDEAGEKRKIGALTHDDLFYDRDKNFKRNRAEPIMRAFGLDLINIDLKHTQNSFRTSALINEKTSRSLKRLLQSTESSLNASIIFPNNEPQYPETFTVCDLQKNIKTSNFPCINDILGPYIQLNDNIEEKIEDLDLNHIVNIFPGSIIASDNFSLLVLTAEIYSRNGFLDAHAERSGDSYPESIGDSSNEYQNWKVCIIKESEGGSSISKLNIGTKKFNILITGSLMIYPTCDSPVMFGPQCQPLLQNQNLNTSCLFFQKDKIDKLGKNTSQVNKSSLCRQLNSAFAHKSTYLCYRSNLFENNLRQPATLFTLYMLPNNGFGSSSANSCREISLFFSFVFECCNGLKKIKDINQYFTTESTNKKLNEITKNIKRMIKDNENTDILQALSVQKGVSSLAQSISAPLFVANKKLADATFNHVQTLFNY